MNNLDSSDFTRISPPQSEGFPRLADPEDYVACTWDLRVDSKKRAYWLGHFRRHFPTLLEEALREAISCGQGERAAKNRVEQCLEAFNTYLDEAAQAPEHFDRLDILVIDEAREQLLRRFDFPNPYRLAKQRENDSALALLPDLLEELDALPSAPRAQRVIECILAGNIFDLGAPQTIELINKGGGGFHDTRNGLPPRPWLVDDLDDWLDCLLSRPPHRCAVLFVDNAGTDVVLGMIPFARDLLQRGTKVILAANTLPSLNDITHAELVSLIGRIADCDNTIEEAHRDGRLQLIASGSGYPLLDLGRISSELVAAVVREGTDLIVLEGMGRAIESNYHARFTCDALKIAMIKDSDVAQTLGGQIYDLVVRFSRCNR